MSSDDGHADYDVIVVGGGPAGCAFTRSLIGRDSTLRALLVDKSRFPRDKVCGDALTHHAIPAVRRVFPELQWLTPSDSFTSREVLQYPNGRSLVREGRALDVIPRVDFDNALWQATTDAGAETLEGARVTGILTDGGRVRGVKVQRDGAERVLTCRLLVGADGSRSVVRRATGLPDRDYVIHALRHYVRDVPETTNGLIFFFDLPHWGYFWIFPFVRDGERWANLGYGNASDNRRLKERFWHYCRTPEVRRYLGDARFEGKLVGFPLNMARFTWTGRLSRPLWGPGYILLGDAASLIHPLSGEGISFAIESGRIAADILLDARIRPARKGRAYERQVLRHVRPRFLSVTAFCAIRLPMLLPRWLSNLYIGAAWGAQRILGPALCPSRSAPLADHDGLASARSTEPVRPRRVPGRAGRYLVVEAWILAGLLGSLALFWSIRLLGGGIVGSPYGLRAMLFTGLATLFCLLHARRWQGPRFAFLCFGVAFGISLAVELVGTLTGVVFGPYHYSVNVPARLLGLVPVVVPFVWFVLSYLSYSIADALGARRPPTSGAEGPRLVSRALVGAGLLVAYDLVADPNHIARGGWTYSGGGVYYGVPFQNFVAWYALGFAILLVLGAVQSRIDSRRGAHPDPVLSLLGVVAYVGVLVHESLFAILIASHPGAGVFGLGVAAGVLALWLRRRRPAP
jgi:menaquinone-9 beta-reductase